VQQPPGPAPPVLNISTGAPFDRRIDDSLEDTFSGSYAQSLNAPGTSAPTDASPCFAKEELELWRVVKDEDLATAFRRPCSKPGRWSTEGAPVIYAADSSATALLEYLAHLDDAPPSLLYLAKAILPGDLALAASALPSTWCSSEYQPEVQAVGNDWSHSRNSLVLQVPSAVCPGSSNYLINTMHEDTRRIIVGEPTSFELDRRLFRGVQRDRY